MIREEEREKGETSVGTTSSCCLYAPMPKTTVNRTLYWIATGVRRRPSENSCRGAWALQQARVIGRPLPGISARNSRFFVSPAQLECASWRMAVARGLFRGSRWQCHCPVFPTMSRGRTARPVVISIRAETRAAVMFMVFLRRGRCRILLSAIAIDEFICHGLVKSSPRDR